MGRWGWAVMGAAALVVSGCAGMKLQTAAAEPPVLVTSAACEDMTLPIYFDKGSTELTAPAAQALRESAVLTRDCAVKEVLVLGLADADGPTNRNLELSRRRAERVAAALAAEGLPAPAFDLEAAGEAGAVTPSGRPEPLRRRAEVVIRLGPAAKQES